MSCPKVIGPAHGHGPAHGPLSGSSPWLRARVLQKRGPPQGSTPKQPRSHCNRSYRRWSQRSFRCIELNISELNFITTRHSSLVSCMQQLKREPSMCQPWGQKYKTTLRTGTALHTHWARTPAHTEHSTAHRHGGDPTLALLEGLLKSP